MTDRQRKLRDEAAQTYVANPRHPQEVLADLLIAHKAGADYWHARARVLEVALEAWLIWEADQIKKAGPYEGKAINELINNGREALTRYRDGGGAV